MSIDIPYNKIAEWLSSRHQIPDNWPQLLKGLHARVAVALEGNYPSQTNLAGFLQSNKDNMNYLKTSEFYDLLLESEEALKVNLLGRYTSEHIIKWRNVLDTFKRKNLYLADICRNMTRHISYNMPAQNKALESFRKQIGDLQKKLQDTNKLEEIFKTKLKDFLRSYGLEEIEINDLDIDEETYKKKIQAHFSSKLPIIFSKSIILIKKVSPVTELYETFVAFQGSSLQSPFLNFLKFLAKHGNVSLDVARELDTNIIEAVEALNSEKQIKTHSKSIETDYQICLEGQGMQNEDKNKMKDLISSPKAEKLPRSDTQLPKYHSQTILEHTISRNLLLNDLYEAKAFLLQRSNEQETKKSKLSLEENTDLSGKLSMPDETLRTWIVDIDKLLELLSGNQTLELIRLQKHERNQIRIIDQAKNLRDLSQRPKHLRYNLNRRIEELQREIVEIQSRLEEYKLETTKMKAVAESAITNLMGYKARIVGI